MTLKRMTSAKLRHRITFKQQTVTQGEYGEPIVALSDFATVWAAIEPYKSDERYDADRRETDITHRIRIRYLPGLDPTMEVHFGSRVFEILGPPMDIDELRYEMEITVRERVTP